MPQALGMSKHLLAGAQLRPHRTNAHGFKPACSAATSRRSRTLLDDALEAADATGAMRARVFAQPRLVQEREAGVCDNHVPIACNVGRWSEFSEVHQCLPLDRRATSGNARDLGLVRTDGARCAQCTIAPRTDLLGLSHEAGIGGPVRS